MPTLRKYDKMLSVLLGGVILAYTITIADNDERVIKSIKETILSVNSSINIERTFTDGKALLHYLQHNFVNVVICDCDIINVSGYRIAEYASEFSPETFVLLTGKIRSFETVKNALKAGANNYLLKPINKKELRETIEKLYNSKNIYSSFALRSVIGYIEDIVKTKFDENELLSESLSYTKNVIEKANEYINANYHKDITRKDVADAVYMNPSYFSRYYKQKTGMFYSDYLTNVRINHAKELMKTDKTLSEISREVGYNTRRYFNSNFLTIVGMTPKEYRLQLKKD